MAVLGVFGVGCGSTVDVPSAPQLMYGTASAYPSVCPQGGQLVSFGYDTNFNGVLDYSEVQSFLNICDGSTGANGANGLNGNQGATGAQGAQGDTGASGEQGPAGNDGTNGLDAAPVLFASFPASPAACPNSTADASGNLGYMVDEWQDTDDNGVLTENEQGQAIEPYTQFVVCNGAQGNTGETGATGTQIAFTSAPATDCGDVGGTTVSAGLDLDGDGTLDNGETASTTFDVCNGATGAQGETGADGHSVVQATTADDGTNCGSVGGQVITLYLDNDDSGALSDGDTQVGDPIVVCNGQTGTTGAAGPAGEDGAAGTNGVNALSSVLVCSGTLDTGSSHNHDYHTAKFSAFVFSSGDALLYGSVDGNSNVGFAAAPISGTQTLSVSGFLVSYTFSANLGTSVVKVSTDSQHTATLSCTSSHL